MKFIIPLRQYASMAVNPLSGIRVVDMTRVLAGPFCSMLLGDLGAEIIKVERPGVGDETREWGPPFIAGESCYFLSINRNKKSLAVNLKHPEGIKVVQKLVGVSDVLLENYIPGKLEELGLGYDQLKTVNPGLIYCSITGYGQSGPYSKRGGYDLTASGMGGLMNITGPQEGDPCKVGVAMTDLSTGLYAKGAILAALLHRMKTGEGQRIDANLLSTQVSLLTHLAANYLMAGTEAKRWGTQHQSIVPYQAFKTSDGYLIIGAGNDQHFRTLCKRIDLLELADDPSFQRNAKRVANRDKLLPILSKRLLERTTGEWLEALEGCGFPYGPINTMSQVFSDPQVVHNNMILEMEHPTVGNIRVPGHAVRYSNIEPEGRLAPPTLGQHTADILTSLLGYSQSEVDELHREKAIALPV
ncbi:succinyl-CoA:glutarate CoA-transferase-like [Diadema antillarum]|uniref:succinyl-CoA:glutarate CoA-transferase-like n=1 Tax=Diadema antillarum TaxID=105358 RepID=UPI003A84A716